MPSPSLEPTWPPEPTPTAITLPLAWPSPRPLPKLAGNAASSNAATGNAAAPLPSPTIGPTPLPSDEWVPDRFPQADESPDVEQIPEQAPEPPDWFDVEASFEDGAVRMALFTALPVAALLGFFGVFVLLKRDIFETFALAQLSVAGSALGIFLHFVPILGAIALVAGGVVLCSAPRPVRRLPRESFTAILYLIGAALAVVWIAKGAPDQGRILDLVQGNFHSVKSRETIALSVVFLLIAVVQFLFHKQFVLVAFDNEYAAGAGYRPALWNFLFLATVGVAIAYAVRSTGMLFTTGMLVLPAAAALAVLGRLRHALLLAPILAMAAVVLGLHFAALAVAPGPAVVVAVSFGLMLPFLGYGWWRGR